MFIGNFAALFAIMPFYDFSLEATMSFLGSPLSDPDGRVPLLIVQAMASFFAFVLAPLLYIRMYEKGDLTNYTKGPEPMSSAVMLSVLMAFTFMFVNAPIIEWNINIQFPKFFEDFARPQEELLQRITEYLTDFDNTGQFLLATLIIAILPGIGEELLFRGLIQNKFNKIFKNIHVAIWASALLFGIFHMQFYGMFPRMLLGVLFGYLYWWSGSLLLAVIAHAFNNGFTLLMVFMYQQGATDFDIEGTEEISWSAIAFSTLAFALLSHQFFKRIKHQPLNG
ncbi:MAG: CPBP family intramembrane glutamic endopeptidase [Cyclobacteriaceae bacterium]